MAAGPNRQLSSFERRFQRLEDRVRKLRLGGSGVEELAMTSLLHTGWFDDSFSRSLVAYRDEGRVWFVGEITYVEATVGAVEHAALAEMPEGWLPSTYQP